MFKETDLDKQDVQYVFGVFDDDLNETIIHMCNMAENRANRLSGQLESWDGVMGLDRHLELLNESHLKELDGFRKELVKIDQLLGNIQDVISMRLGLTEKDNGGWTRQSHQSANTDNNSEETSS